MQHAKLDGIISSSDGRPRGMASCRHNGIYLCKREGANLVRDRSLPHLTNKVDKKNQRYFFMPSSQLFVC